MGFSGCQRFFKFYTLARSPAALSYESRHHQRWDISCVYMGREYYCAAPGASREGQRYLISRRAIG